MSGLTQLKDARAGFRTQSTTDDQQQGRNELAEYVNLNGKGMGIKSD